MITDVPTVSPVMSPEPSNPTLLFDALHEPPEISSANVIVEPLQTAAVPVIASGEGLTVSTVVIWQPVGNM